LISEWRYDSQRYEPAEPFTTDDSVMIEEAYVARQIREISDLQRYLPLLTEISMEIVFEEIENVPLDNVLNSRCPVQVEAKDYSNTC
jgi:hypothetical protein